MLERASSCLEPAAQNLFRSIEAPTRSQRRLPQAFWRHARIEQEHTSWWPAYLDDIRRIAKARDASNDGSISAQRVGAGLLPFASQHWSLAENGNAYSRQNANSPNRRHISKIVKQSRTKDEKAFEDALEPKDAEPPPAEVALFAPEGIPEPRKPREGMSVGRRLEELLRAGDEPKYNAVWLTFISLKEQAGFARAVLRYLSRATAPVVLKRALRTFQMIEVEDRTHLTYESAVRAAIGLRKYATANKFVLEALQRGLGAECSQLLMGHLIEREMWRSAIQALRVFVANTKFKPESQKITNHHVLQHMHEGPVWKTVDSMLSLPQKLIALSKRLENKDAVLALDKEDIEYLATRLLERALRSTTIMGIITAEGVLALFDGYRKLGLLRMQHYLDALSALRSLRETRNRSQLALLIFRNMRSFYPRYRLHDSTYGTMISILSAAPNESMAFEYILKDVTLAYDSEVSNRKRDLAMYQRVMSACAEQGHTTYVKRLLQRLIRDHGVPKDLAYFTPLLLSTAKRGDILGTKRSFDDLSSTYSLKPDHQCWNILMLAYTRADDFDGAAALYRQMESLGIPADAYTFGTLMSMCSNAGDTQAVLQLVDMARRQRIPVTTAMIDTIVHSYCLNEQVSEAESLVEAATKMSLSGSPTRMWNILLRHYAFRADSGAVLKTQERMREFAVKPDAMTYAALMTSLVIVGKTKDAAAILRSLHLSQITTASRFHYSIVFHGYVQEGQREQAMVIYAEMIERFHRPSPSAQLAMMHLQSQHDELQAQNQAVEGAAGWAGHVPKSASPLQSHTIDFLADALLEMNNAETLSDEPQPGFRRRKPISTASGAFLEVPVAVLNLASSYEKAQKLVGRYQAVIEASSMTKQQKSYQTVQLMTAHLRGLVRSYEGSGKSTAYLRKQSCNRIDAIWSKIFTQVLSSVKERRLDSLADGPSQSVRDGTSGQTSASSADYEAGGSGTLSKANTRDAAVLLVENFVSIIPAKRYALSVPLSIYMRGLALQQRLPKLESLLQTVRSVGFELTSKNWNTYVQLLSEKEETILQAFCIFEEKLLPNAPPWDLLKRGKVSFARLDDTLPPETDTSGVDSIPLSRKTVERKDPGRLVPTYFTVIHLAAAFIKMYRAQSGEGDRAGDSELTSLYDELRRQAPGTVKLIQAMPLLKDRAQGVLLRGRAVKGDLTKKPRKLQLVDRAGLLGKRLPLQEVSSEQLDMLERSKEAEQELQSFSKEVGPLATQKALVATSPKISKNTEAQTQLTPAQSVERNHWSQQRMTDAQDSAAHMIADEVHGDQYIDGLSSWEAASGPDRGRPSTLSLFQEHNSQLPIKDHGLPAQPLARSRFEENLENLRRTANKPERAPPHWQIRSTRRRQMNQRVIAYPVKASQKLLLKPMSNYTHKDHIFTKPMLTMPVPRRRQLGSERRAFDLPKKYMDLKKQREKSVRKAQAKARKLRKSRENWWDQHGTRAGQNIITAEDATAFLEERLVGRERQSAETELGQAIAFNTQVVEEPARAQQHYPTKTDRQSSRAIIEENQQASKGAGDVPQAKEEDDDSFLKARFVDATPLKDDAQSSNEESFLPWGQLGQFDEKDFVEQQNAGKDR